MGSWVNISESWYQMVDKAKKVARGNNIHITGPCRFSALRRGTYQAELVFSGVQRGEQYSGNRSYTPIKAEFANGQMAVERVL